MEKIYKNKPLRIVPVHEVMPLYKMVDKVTTNRDELLDGFKDYVYRNRSHNTAKNYVSIISRFLSKLSYSKPKLSVRDVRGFLENKPHSYHAAVKIFLDMCEDIFNKRFDSFKYPGIRKPKTLPVVTLTEDKVNKVINNLSEKYKFLCEVQYKLGLRASEPFYILNKDFNWESWFEDTTKNGSVIIRVSKGGEQIKKPVNPKLMKSIFEFSNKENGGVYPETLLFNFDHDLYVKKKYKRSFRRRVKVPVFWNDIEEYKIILREKIERIYIENHVKEYCKEFSKVAKEKLNIDCSSHILRKSRATNMLKAGVPLLQVKLFLGHKKVETTMKYLQSDYSELDESMLKLGL